MSTNQKSIKEFAEELKKFTSEFNEIHNTRHLFYYIDMFNTWEVTHSERNRECLSLLSALGGKDNLTIHRWEAEHSRVEFKNIKAIRELLPRLTKEMMKINEKSRKIYYESFEAEEDRKKNIRKENARKNEPYLSRMSYEEREKYEFSLMLETELVDISSSEYVLINIQGE